MTIHPANATFNFQTSAASSSLDFGALDFTSPLAGVHAAAAPTSAKGSMDFRQTLLERIKSSSTDDNKVVSASDKAQEAAQQFISTALVLPMLKQMRSSAFKSDLFHGGQGEDAFGPQLDQILSDRIVQRMSTPQSISASGSATQGMGLVDAVYKQIMRSAEHHTTRPMKPVGNAASPAMSGDVKPTSRVDLQG